jgi:hypothetical protein
MGETGEDGVRLHEDQEPYRLRREMERPKPLLDAVLYGT